MNTTNIVDGVQTDTEMDNTKHNCVTKAEAQNEFLNESCSKLTTRTSQIMPDKPTFYTTVKMQKTFYGLISVTLGLEF